MATDGTLTPTVMLPSAGEWEICAWAKGYWSPCRRVTLTADEELVTTAVVSLWPAADLTGRLVWPDQRRGNGEAFPRWLRVQFSASDRTPEALPASESRCPVDEEGRWRCSVPAGRLDLVVRPLGYVPDYRWDVAAGAGSKIELGEMALRSGASVSGNVQVEEADFDATHCEVALIPMVAPGAGSREAERLAAVRYRGEVSRRGFFQITGVPPGTYVVEARQPGLAPGRQAPIQVWEESETVLGEPVELRPPLTLVFELRPPVDWLGRPWKVSMVPATGFTGQDVGLRPEEKPVAEDGVVSFTERGPGVYRLQVFDALGQSFYIDPAVTVQSAADTRRRVELPIVSIDGRVRIGDELLPATLYFGGRFGGFRSEIETDDEGEFVGALPKPGLWRVLVEADEPEISTQVEVDVDPGDSTHASVDVELPDTEVFGRVVDAAETPVAGVRVTLRSAGLGTGATTDSTGSFSLRGFEPGAVSLTARHRFENRELDADTLLADVAEGQVVGPLRLQLLGVETRAGRVVTTAGVPVAGAVLQVSTLHPENATFSAAARSALNGSFEVSVREGTMSLQVLASAAGHALTAVETAPTEPIVVEVPLETGLLEVSLGTVSGGANETITIFQNGLALPPPLLSSWARAHGESFDRDSGLLRIPALAPGRYQACRGAPSRLTAAAIQQGDWRRGFDLCADGFLSAGSELHLDLDSRQDSSIDDKESNK